MDTLLVVEDSKSFSQVLKERIEATPDCRVVLARSLAEAREAVEAARGGATFFLGVLDLHLPDAPDGEIVDLVLGESIPAIVLTGNYEKGFRDRIMAKGVLDYFIKDNIRVIDSVIYFIDRIRRNRNTRVLVVDDSRSFRAMVCHFLERYGFEVLQAADGQAALKILDERQPVKLVLTDYQMAGMDGFRLTKMIRAKHSREEVAIIGISSTSSDDLAARFIKAGANDFLIKPFRNEELFCRVSQNIEIVEKYGALEKLVEERTERLAKAMERVRARENYLKSVLETALDAIITTDQGGWVVDFNPAAEKLFGYGRREMLGRNLLETIIPPEYRERHREVMESWLKDSGADGERKRLKRRIEMPGLRADGGQIDLEMALTSVENAGQVFFTGFMHDITERKQLVKSLEETLTVAESANRAKSEFLANMSHEIRTPMNAIIGMTDLLLQTTVSEEQREFLTIVAQSSQSLLELINSILDLSKIEAGRLRLESIPFDLLGRLENIVETLAVRAHQKDLELWCRVESGLPETLHGDPLRLGQILINLVNNAIKFTETGQVVVRVARERAPVGDEECLRLRFSIADSGIGIPKDRQEQIFERFTQADGSTTRQFGGTGLGLTISRSLVGLMGGEIWVDSAPGQGSTFHFTADFGIGRRGAHREDLVMEERSRGGVPEAPLAGVNLLVALANPPGAAIVAALAGEFGALTRAVAVPGELAAALDQARDAGQPCDVLILDQVGPGPGRHLPEGWATHPGWRGQALFLMASHQRLENPVPDLPLRAVMALRKPVKKFALLRGINKVLGREPPPTSDQASAAAVAPVRSSLAILLVEDLVNNQKLATGTLERLGHRVTVANNGREGLDWLAKRPFDLILMDLQMPELDGYATAREIRTGTTLPPDRRGIPIVAATAHAMESERRRCLEAGMNGFLRKPYRPQELKETLEPFLHPIPTAPAPPPPALPVEEPSSIKAPGRPVLVEGTGPPEAVTAAREQFRREAPEQMAELRRHMDGQDPRQARKAAEWLKKVAVAVGASRVKMQAIRLIGKVEMKSWEDAGHLFADLEREVADVLGLLEQ
ncbi:MAG: response regulator [Magnetococcales bacterium]|nr:response regulator [Magnetococcales bacterium]